MNYIRRFKGPLIGSTILIAIIGYKNQSWFEYNKDFKPPYPFFTSYRLKELVHEYPCDKEEHVSYSIQIPEIGGLGDPDPEYVKDTCVCKVKFEMNRSGFRTFYGFYRSKNPEQTYPFKWVSEDTDEVVSKHIRDN